MGRYVYLLGMILLFAAICFAGKYVAEFTEIGISARSSGLGGAFSSVDGGVQSQFYNPAGIKPEIQGYLMHSMLYDNLFNIDAGVFSYPVKEFRPALALARFATDDIPFTRDDGFYDWGTDGIPGTNDSDGTENNGIKDPGEPVRADMVDYETEGDYLVLLGTAYPINEKLDAGINIKYLHHNIGGYTSNGWGIDLGAQYCLNDRIRLGAALRDAIGTRVKWSTDFTETKLPTLDLAGHYRYPLPMKKSDMKFLMSLETKFENAQGFIQPGPLSIEPHLGVEADFFDIFKVRGGFRRGDWSAGAGLKFFDFEIDYAFLSGELDQSHRIGVTFTYHPPEKPQPIDPIVSIDTIENAEPKPQPEPEPIPEPEPEDKEEPPKSDEIIGEIYFEIAKANIDQDSYQNLDETFRILTKFGDIYVIIEGHTDRTPIDTEEYPNNQVLSEARAQAVYDYLVSKGIDKARMRTIGYSSEKAKFAGNEAYRNRRVTIKVE